MSRKEGADRVRHKMREWAEGKSYWIDHVFLYTWSIGACVTAVVALCALTFDWSLSTSATIQDLPPTVKVLIAVGFGLGGLLTARGVRLNYAPNESGGLVLLATCAAVIATGRLLEADPIGIIGVFTALGLYLRAVVVVCASRLLERRRTNGSR